MPTPAKIIRNTAIRTQAAHGISHPDLARQHGLTRERIGQIAGRKGRKQVPASQRTQEIYAFLVEYMTNHQGLPPTYREIGQHFELANSMVFYYLRKLADQHLIAFHRTDLGASRNFYLPGATWTPPQT